MKTIIFIMIALLSSATFANVDELFNRIQKQHENRKERIQSLRDKKHTRIGNLKDNREAKTQNINNKISSIKEKIKELSKGKKNANTLSKIFKLKGQITKLKSSKYYVKEKKREKRREIASKIHEKVEHVREKSKVRKKHLKEKLKKQLKAKPVAKLKIDPKKCDSPCVATLDASKSKAKHGKSIVSYVFRTGDGTRVEQSSPILEHTYVFTHYKKNKSKIFHPSVVVIDSAGRRSQESRKSINIKAGDMDPEPTPTPTPEPTPTPAPIGPTAAISTNVATAFVGDTISIDASASTAGDSAISTYAFDFGDGTNLTSSSASTNHLYATAGTYTVSVNVIDANGLSSIANAQVVINNHVAPTANLVSDKSSVYIGDTISLSAVGSGEGSSAISSYSYDLGDGRVQAGGSSLDITYPAAGVYTVVVTVTDVNGLQDAAEVSLEVKAHVAPTAALTIDKASVFIGDMINLNAGGSTAGSSAIASYSYNLGNGRVEVGGSALSTSFAAAGNFSIAVIVTDVNGLTSSANVGVEVKTHMAPTVALGVSLPKVYIGESITLSAAGTAPGTTPIVSYAYDLGDGRVEEGGTSINISYSLAGVQDITLIVKDTNGLLGYGTTSVEVIERVLPTLVFECISNGIKSLDCTAVDSLKGDSDIFEYKWDMGDGTNLVGPSVSHVYSTEGEKIVTATLVDAKGGEVNDSKTFRVISNQIPVAAFNCSSTKPRVLNCDASSSSDSDGVIANYSWNEESIISKTGKIVEIEFPLGGTKTITLSVQDDLGKKVELSKEIDVLINQGPIASIVCTTNFLEVSCSGESSSDSDGTLESFSWLLSDGTEIETKTFKHKFLEAGDYAVTLMVKDNFSSSFQTTNTITVKENQAPLITFNCNIVNKTISCDATGSTDSDGNIALYNWDMGDGTTLTGAEVTHNFQTAGQKSISLSLQDELGLTSVMSQTIEILPNKVPVALIICVVNGLKLNCDGSTSSDTDGSIVSYSWTIDTPDGVGTGPSYDVPSFEITSEDEVEVTINLLVTDNEGLSSSASKDISLVMPPTPVGPEAYFKYFIEEQNIALLYFGNKGSSEIVSGYYEIEESGEKINLNDFYSANIQELLDLEVGQYNIKLTITDENGLSSSFSQSIDTAEFSNSLVLDFDLTQSDNLTVFMNAFRTFDALDEGFYLRIDWGDGNITEEVYNYFQGHTYQSPGNYNVTVTNVSDRGVEVTKSKSIEITDESVPVLSPIANFYYEHVDFADYATFQVSISGTPNGFIESYSWDFGDGGTGTGEEVVHIFEPGTYEVKLTVTDSIGLQSEQIQRVLITGSGDPVIVGSDCQLIDKNVVFCDGGGGADRLEQLTHFEIDWDDGTPILSLPSQSNIWGSFDEEHTYVEDGIYNIKISAHTSRGEVKEIVKTIEVKTNDDPLISLECTEFNAKVTCQLPLLFDPDGFIADVVWDWGNGEVESRNHTANTKIYDVPGDYTISVKAIDNLGAETIVSQTITVHQRVNIEPLVYFTCFSPAPLRSHCQANASYDSDGYIASYTWSYEDGEEVTSDKPYGVIKDFSTSGNKNITLTLIDNEGGVSELTKIVFVKDNILPTVAFSCVSNIIRQVRCNSFGSRDDDGSIDNYIWDMGDGTVINDSQVIHEYSKGGIQPISLTLVDNLGGETTLTKNTSVLENQLPSPVIKCTKDFLSINCNALSSFDPDGAVKSYQWTLPDGEVFNTTHIIADFAVGGPKEIKLKIVDYYDEFTEITETIVLKDNEAPVAKINCSRVSQNEYSCDSYGTEDPDSNISSYKIDWGDSSVTNSFLGKHTYSQNGHYNVSLTVTDQKGLSSSDSTTVTVQSPPIASINNSADFQEVPLSVNFSANTQTVGTIVSYHWNFGDGNTVNGQNVSNVFKIKGKYSVVLTVVDNLGQIGTSSIEINALENLSPPPNPEDVMSPIAKNIIPNISETISFLYEGESNQIQKNVEPGVISKKRAGVIAGTVKDQSGNPIPMVMVKILNHSEFGYTLTRSDGQFDMAVNAGATLDVLFEKSGFVSTQRSFKTNIEDFSVNDDINLVKQSTQNNELNLAAGASLIASSDVISDGFGSGQVKAFFPSGVKAKLKHTSGAETDLSNLNLKITALPINGLDNLPIDIKDPSNIRRVIEFGVAEAVNSTVKSVKFDKKVPFYVSNDGLPVGDVVGLLSIEKDTGKVTQVPNMGFVMKVVGVDEDNRAMLDFQNNGLPESEELLLGLNLSLEEREKIAQTYSVGDEFQRFEVDHFSKYAICNRHIRRPSGQLVCNCTFDLGYGPQFTSWCDQDYGPVITTEEIYVKNREAFTDSLVVLKPKLACGSTIDIFNRNLGETIDVPGANFSLEYQSERVQTSLGYKIDIPLMKNVPDAVFEINLNVTVAGQKIVNQKFTPAANLSHTVNWNGLDRYGRKLKGTQLANVRISYGFYVNPDENRRMTWVSQDYRIPIGDHDNSILGMGDWNLSNYHFYDKKAGHIKLGGGGYYDPKFLSGETISLVESLPASQEMFEVYRQHVRCSLTSLLQSQTDYCPGLISSNGVIATGKPASIGSMTLEEVKRTFLSGSSLVADKFGLKLYTKQFSATQALGIIAVNLNQKKVFITSQGGEPSGNYPGRANHLHAYLIQDSNNFHYVSGGGGSYDVNQKDSNGEWITVRRNSARNMAFYKYSFNSSIYEVSVPKLTRDLFLSKLPDYKTRGSLGDIDFNLVVINSQKYSRDSFDAAGNDVGSFVIDNKLTYQQGPDGEQLWINQPFHENTDEYRNIAPIQGATVSRDGKIYFSVLNSVVKYENNTLSVFAGIPGQSCGDSEVESSKLYFHTDSSGEKSCRLFKPTNPEAGLVCEPFVSYDIPLVCNYDTYAYVDERLKLSERGSSCSSTLILNGEATKTCLPQYFELDTNDNGDLFIFANNKGFEADSSAYSLFLKVDKNNKISKLFNTTYKVNIDKGEQLNGVDVSSSSIGVVTKGRLLNDHTIGFLDNSGSTGSTAEVGFRTINLNTNQIDLVSIINSNNYVSGSKHQKLSTTGLAGFYLDPFDQNIKDGRGRILNGEIQNINDGLLSLGPDGNMLRFNGFGKQVETIDSKTGLVIREYVHDENQDLIRIVENGSKTYEFSRDGNGKITSVSDENDLLAIVNYNSEGRLSSVLTPNNDTREVEYNVGTGLISKFLDGNQNATTFNFVGRKLASEVNAANSTLTLQRTKGANGEITYSGIRDGVAFSDTTITQSAKYIDERIFSNRQGIESKVETGKEGKTIVTSSNGSISETVYNPANHPFGNIPIPTEQVFKTPAGLLLSVERQDAYTFSDSKDPLSLKLFRSISYINEKKFETRFTKASSTWETFSPEGRRSSSTINEKGHVVSSFVPGLTSVGSLFDEQGNITELSQGDRISIFGYDTRGYLNSVTNALEETTTFINDENGQVLKQTLPSGDEIDFTYDGNGNISSIKPAGRPLHNFFYTVLNFVGEYIPPLLGGVEKKTEYFYDNEKRLDRVVRPDNIVIDYNYNTKGQLSTIIVPNDPIALGYDTTSGQLLNLTQGSNAIDFNYDGALVTDYTWAGDISGSFEINYNNDFRVESTSVNGSNGTTFTYDNDGLLIGANGVTLTRDAQNGLLDSFSNGVVSNDFSYSNFGEVELQDVKVSGVSLINLSYERDKLGRILKKTSIVGSTTTVNDYDYDLNGQLIEVKENGVIVESFDYDSNGNRNSYNGNIATYDSQDRLTKIGLPTVIQYNDNGDTSRIINGVVETLLNYDVFGNLKTAKAESGVNIEYIMDPMNRRIGKKVGGVLVQGFLYQDQLNPVAELDGSGNVISHFVYATKSNVPDLMVKGGVSYQIVSNHLGSPIFVVNSDNGTIVQEMRYDTFGKVTFDSNPGFQPFGFAGGIYDRDLNLVRFGARDYSAVTGRWMQKDPSLFNGFDSNLYRYSNNNPVNFLDPDGLSYIEFDKISGELNIYKDSGDLLKTFKAQNNVQSSSKGAFPKGKFNFSWYSLAKVTDGPDTDRGSNGNFIFEVLNRSALGIHSGRANSTDALGGSGINHVTDGCIRTTDKATKFLRNLHKKDPIKYLEVK